VPPSISQMEKIAKCNQLVAKAILMDEKKRSSELLSSEEEIELAYFMADIFSSSLVAKVQNKVKANLFNKMGAGAAETLNSMSRQLDMVNNQIIKNKPKPSEIIQAATNVALAGAKPMSQAMAVAQQSTLAAIQNNALNVLMLEAYDKQQQDLRSDSASNKGILAMSDMKKRLEAFKAAKKIDQKISNSDKNNKQPDIIEVNDNSKFGWDNTEALKEQGMDPLDLIRKYVKLQRKIVLRGNKVFFREQSFPSDTLTKLKISKNPGESIDHYTVGCLAYFIQNINDDHPEYVRKCICENIKCVRRPDRLNVQQYLTGQKDFVLNLDNQVTEYGSGAAVPCDTERRSARRSRSRSSSRDRSRRSRSRSRRSRSRDRRHEPSQHFRSGDSRMSADLSYKRSFPNESNVESRFNQRESQFDVRQSESHQRTNNDFFVSHQNIYGQFQEFGEERPRLFDQRPPGFASTGGWSGCDQRPVMTFQENQNFAHYQGRSAFDQMPGEYQPFVGRHSRDREMEGTRNNQQHHNDLRFNSTRYDEMNTLSQMKTHFPSERNLSHSYQKDDDLEYDRGFPPTVPSSDRDSEEASNVSKSLGPMFVIQSNNPPSSGRRW